MAVDKPFWQSTPLAQMTRTQWESLCDGCGQCCLVKLEDEQTKALFVTNIACHMLDMDTCRCGDYAHRLEKVSTCLQLSPEQPEVFAQLPHSCAYRCLAENRPLPHWHPLRSGDPQTVHQAGISVRDYAVSEEYIHPDQFEDHITGPLE